MFYGKVLSFASALLASSLFQDVEGRICMIGDSIMSGDGNGIKTSLEEFSNFHNIENYAVSGARLMSSGGSWFGSTGPIREQIDAFMQNGEAPNLVIANGGGNDIIAVNPDTCKWYDQNVIPTSLDMFSEECQNLHRDIGSHIMEIFEKLNENGVKRVIYLQYHHLPGGRESLTPSTNIANQEIVGICQAAEAKMEGFKCDIADFVGNLDAADNVISGDGVHPTYAGHRIIAEAVWEVCLNEEYPSLFF